VNVAEIAGALARRIQPVSDLGGLGMARILCGFVALCEILSYF
jgi:hypothetical protein